jgi:hypothetical protein
MTKIYKSMSTKMKIKIKFKMNLTSKCNSKLMMSFKLIKMNNLIKILKTNNIIITKSKNIIKR